MVLTVYYKDSSLKQVSDVCTIQYFDFDDVLVVEGGPYTAAYPLEIFHFNSVVACVSLAPEVVDE